MEWLTVGAPLLAGKQGERPRTPRRRGRAVQRVEIARKP